MDLLIKDMDMPKSCDICPFMTTNDNLSVEDYRYMYCGFPGIGEFVTDYEATRHPDCPLFPVPTPHGDLIDRNKLLKKGINLDWSVQKWVSEVDISLMPAIIKAEEGEPDE